MNDRGFKVTGTVRLPAVSKPFQNAAAHISVQDVSRMDVSATIIASEMTRLSVSEDDIESGREISFEFTIHGEIPDERNIYVVNVHIDVDGNGKISKGDYITTGLYSVLTRGYPDRVVVNVNEV
jgi:hypothetical protein